jgi:hypothetical protein
MTYRVLAAMLPSLPAPSLPRSRFAIGVVLAVLLAAACREDPDALLLRVTARERVDTYSLLVLSSSGEIRYETTNEPVDQDNPFRDISQAEEALKLALRFAGPDEVVLHVAGYSSGPVQVATIRTSVKGTRTLDVELVPLAGADADRDSFPSAADCAALADTGLRCDLVDCDDLDPHSHPGASEICGNGRDENCDGVDAPCPDEDGDGVPSDRDCDDHDPDRSPEIFEGPNDCGHPGENPRCEDGVDNDCDGVDAACVTDDDCDGFSPPFDCDDGNAAIFPGAGELCRNGVDDNCNGVTDEGCVDCDVDGDGAPRLDPAAGCDPAPEAADCNDQDAGIGPTVTADCGGDEGAPACARRGLCNGQDDDCDGLIDEGCPDPACDADGDGFLRDDAVAGCAPAPGYADCDDASPLVYPGAPDRCGNGIMENCNADTPCTNDADGDGYNAGAGGDCDDGRADVHPGAPEICDGVDNDCDGLIDEGNPDALEGGRIPDDAYCNLSNLGRCGDPSGPGRCVCSRVLPDGPVNPGNRVDCSAFGPDVAAGAPRCFFAIVPEMERCDDLDHDCDGTRGSPGGTTPLVELGQPCGTDAGRCVAGTVMGCNLEATTPGAENEHFECSADFRGPSAEVCNGLDDDCDGVVPAEEADEDGDRFLACTGCEGEILSPDVAGCGDCAPGDPTRYPGAPERCNGLDDDCDGSLADDGADECGGASPTCCAGYGCVDLQTNLQNCGGCGNVCPPETDTCVGGQCTCAGGAPCGAGNVCHGGSCSCSAGWDCGGCCWHDDCVRLYEQSNDRCGNGGHVCSPCNGKTCVAGTCY